VRGGLCPTGVTPTLDAHLDNRRGGRRFRVGSGRDAGHA
jgi:hypothetical protein